MLEMGKYFTHPKNVDEKRYRIQSNVNPSNKRCISKLFVLYNSSKGLVILSLKPKVQDYSEKGGNSRKKRRKFPG